MFKIYKLYSKKKRLYHLGILTFGVLSALIAVITFYGQNTGNFVISIDQDFSRILTLSKDREFLSHGPRLVVNAVEGAKDMTYSWLDIEGAKNTDGDFYDPDHKYVAFTFYLSNHGTEATEVSYSINIQEESNNLGSAIRVLLIEDNKETLYMREDTVPWEYPHDIPQATYFISKNTIFENKIPNFRPNQIKKFTLIMWLEGEDPDCTDDLANGKIKMQMVFRCVGEE